MIKEVRHYFADMPLVMELVDKFEKTKSSWIPVTERLPDARKDIDPVDREIHYISDLVMVTVKPINGNSFVSDDCVADGEWVNYLAPRFDVIAWMPVPEPYKEN